MQRPGRRFARGPCRYRRHGVGIPPVRLGGNLWCATGRDATRLRSGYAAS